MSTRGSRAGNGVKHSGSLLDRIRADVDAGVQADDIREKFDAEGANPSTVDAYLKNYAVSEEVTWASRAKVACEAHLGDLWREHGSVSHAN